MKYILLLAALAVGAPALAASDATSPLPQRAKIMNMIGQLQTLHDKGTGLHGKHQAHTTFGYRICGVAHAPMRAQARQLVDQAGTIKRLHVSAPMTRAAWTAFECTACGAGDIPRNACARLPEEIEQIRNAVKDYD